MVHILYAVVTLVVFLSVSEGNEYCSFSPQHELCQHSGPGPACRSKKDVSLTSEQRETIVDEHNKLRSKVATGGESRGGGQPSAANMQQLVWDDELAKIAQMHADQCVFKHDCRDCRKVSRFGVGQNIYWSSGKGEAADWRGAIKSFYDEVAQFNKASVGSYRFNDRTGHYTQIVWATTKYIGCGRAVYGQEELISCNYGPGGNTLGRPMYQQEEPCSQCGAQSCSSDYDGLCANSAGNGVRYTLLLMAVAAVTALI